MFRENTLLRKNRANQHWDVLGKQFGPKTIREKEAKVKLIGFLSTGRIIYKICMKKPNKKLLIKNVRSSRLTF